VFSLNLNRSSVVNAGKRIRFVVAKIAGARVLASH
jgi:hypothetical protein